MTIVDRYIEFEVAWVEGGPSPLKAVSCAIAEVNDSSRLYAQAQAQAVPQAVTGDIIAPMNE